MNEICIRIKLVSHDKLLLATGPMEIWGNGNETQSRSRVRKREIAKFVRIRGG